MRHQVPLKTPPAIFAAIIATAIILSLCSGCDSHSSDDLTEAESASIDLTTNKYSQEAISSRLINAGWSRQAATTVAELNASYFAILAEYPERLEANFKRLERLGQYENLAIMPRLERHPELAALYAGAQRPLELDRAFLNDDCAGVYSGMFQLIVDPHEQSELAEAFRRHGTNICALGAMGIVAPAAIFIFDRDRPGAKEYALWLDESVARALRAAQPQEPVTTITAFALNQGAYLRNRMLEDADFRRNFRARLWPAFIRVTDCTKKPEGDCDTPFELLAEEPRVWDLLMQERGEELLEQAGLLAVELLTESPDGISFPRDLKPIAREAILEGNNETLAALLQFQQEPLFRQVMLRDDLDPDLRLRILGSLKEICPETASQCPDLEKRLLALNDFSLETLREDLAPEPSGPKTWIPFYSSYYTIKKMAQGREVTGLDMAFLVMDTAFLVVDVATLGSSKAVTQTLKSGGKTLAKEAAESVAKEATKSAGKTSASRAARSASRDFIERAAESGRLMIAVSKRYLKTSVDFTRKVDQMIDKSVSFEMTKPVQWMFEKTGIGRASMKKITGLEARVFMRHDARVIINPRKGYISLLLQNSLEEAAGQQAAQVPDVALDLWQKHASAWWFENAALSY